MASTIEVTADTDSSFSRPALRAALDGITDDDVSVSSPVTDGAPEAAIDHNRDDGVVHVRVEGHDGDFTKTSQQALVSAVRSVDGATDPTVTDGGYEREE